jgi:hypothetical protein
MPPIAVVSPAITWTPERDTVGPTIGSRATSYVPGGTDEMKKSPEEPVIAVNERLGM